jgi:outer membrane protein assembly factor BamB
MYDIIFLKGVRLFMSNNPAEITYETIVGSGRKSCIGHSTAYLLHIPGHYFVAYEALPILYLWVDLNLNNVTIYYADGSVASWTNRLFDAYITQFGISISADGDYIFAQTWENGLYCISSQTGEKIWRTQSKAAVKNIYVNSNTICINRKDKCLELIAPHTGEVIRERKLTIHEFFAVDTCRFMCRTTVKKWEVIDSNTLETVDTFSADDRDSVRSWFAIFYS